MLLIIDIASPLAVSLSDMRAREKPEHQAAIRLRSFESANRAILDSLVTEIRSYDEFLIALSQRRATLGKTMLDLDAKTGLADGHSSKIFCKMCNLGPMSFGLILQALNVKLLVVPDDDE